MCTRCCEDCHSCCAFSRCSSLRLRSTGGFPDPTSQSRCSGLEWAGEALWHLPLPFLPQIQLHAEFDGVQRVWAAGVLELRDMREQLEVGLRHVLTSATPR